MMMKYAQSWVALAGVTLSVGVLGVTQTAFAQQQKAPAAPAMPAATATPASHPLPPRGSQLVFIDQQEIQNDASAFKVLAAQQAKMAGTLQAEVAKREKDLRSADEDLTKQRTVLSPDAYNQKRRDLDNRFQEAQQSVQNRKRDMDQSIGDAYNKVMQEVLQIVGDIVRENDYKVVFERKFLVAAETSLDISGEVVARLNKKMPSVAVATPK